MAIEFPNNPDFGETYYYDGNDTNYIYTSPGYWAADQAGSVGSATSAEVDTGTDAIKYISPDALDGSEYMREVRVNADGGPAVTVGKADTLSLNSGEAMNVTRNASGWTVAAETANATNSGVVQLDDSTDNATANESAGIAATPNAVAQISTVASARVKMFPNETSSNGLDITLDSGTAPGDNLIFKVGRELYTNDDEIGNSTVFAFDSPFENKCVGVWMTILADGSHVGGHPPSGGGSSHGGASMYLDMQDWNNLNKDSFKCYWILHEDNQWDDSDFWFSYLAIGY